MDAMYLNLMFITLDPPSGLSGGPVLMISVRLCVG